MTTFEAVSSSAGHNQAPATTPLTAAFNIPAAANCLVVGAGLDNADSGVGPFTLTYNGVSMTSMGLVHGGGTTYGFIEAFYLMNPATGSSHDIVATALGTPQGYNEINLVAGAYSSAGIPTGFVSNSGTGTAISSSINVASGEIGVHFAIAEKAIATSESHTERAARNDNDFNGAGNIKYQDTATPGTPVNFALTCGSGLWGSIAFVIPSTSVSVPVLLESGLVVMLESNVHTMTE